MKTKYVILIVCSFLISHFSWGQGQIILKLSENQRTHLLTENVGHYLHIKLQDDTVDKVLAKGKIVSFNQAFPLARYFDHPASSRVSQLYYLTYDTASIDMAEELRRTKAFEYIEKVSVPKTLFVPNDISLQSPLAPFALNTIKAQNAWDVTTGNASVKIAILDNGFDINHEDLVNQIVYTGGDVSWHGSGFSHGTSTAGVAGAQTNNNRGISSIGFNSKLMLFLFGDYNNMLSASLNGAKVVSCSFFSQCVPLSYQQDIINMVVGNGTIVVASAANGNAGSSCGVDGNAYVYPASYDNVVSVSGTTIGDSYFNNTTLHFTFNDKVDLTAPGWTVWATYDNNTYSSFDGTSASTPLVSGTVGLMLAVNGCLSPGEIEFILRASADKSVNNTTLHPENAPFVNLSGAGRLNAEAAVKMARDWPQSFAGVASISGPNAVCSSTTYSVLNYTFKTGIVWTSSNPTVLTINPTTGVATRVGGYTGSVTISAVLTGSGGCTTSAITKIVWLGVPIFTDWTIDGLHTSQTPVCPGGHSLTVSHTGGDASSASWIVPPGIQYSVGINNLGINLPPTMPSSVNIVATESNVCGSGQLTFTLIKRTSGCPRSFALSVSPNPVQEELSVAMMALNPEAGFSEEPPAIDEVILFNGNQNIVRSSNLSGDKIKLNVKGLMKGEYILQVRIGREIFTNHVLIE